MAWENDEEARKDCDKHAACTSRSECESRASAWKRALTRSLRRTLIQPTFITDYPVEISPLAKRKPRMTRT